MTHGVLVVSINQAATLPCDTAILQEIRWGGGGGGGGERERKIISLFACNCRNSCSYEGLQWISTAGHHSVLLNSRVQSSGH